MTRLLLSDLASHPRLRPSSSKRLRKSTRIHPPCSAMGARLTSLVIGVLGARAARAKLPCSH
jgi:hypothetical protein